jgi:glycosidase
MKAPKWHPELALLLGALMSLALAACEPMTASDTPAATAADPYEPQPYVTLEHPDWSRDATIYQVNVRQFSQEGTFEAVRQQLPRLKDLGIDILWLMPIHPIGEQNRKGTLGSPYSVRDYFGVNPEFGTLDDLKALVDAAHALDMYVILDWVANHTAWDNPLRTEHPDWYERDWDGDFRPTPWWDWSDIIDLDYSQPGVREYMTEAMKYWVRDVGIDGYRCDVAGFVPVDFWNNVRRELDAIKPVFMLAEWEARDLHARAFDATYAWKWYDAVHGVVNGTKGLSTLFVYYSWRESAWPREAYRLTYVTNHDMNAWDETEFEALGDALEMVITLSVVGDGIPMMYNGQEAGNAKQLAFFEKDPIEWREHPIGGLYRKLFALKKANTALWNGQWGAPMVRAWNSAPDEVLSFIRENDQDKVLAMMNFSGEAQRFTFSDGPFAGEYRDAFSGEKLAVSPDTEFELPAWGYRVLVR